MKRNAVIIIVVLLSVNVLTLVSYYKYKQRSVANITYLATGNVTEKDELYTHKINFKANILNSNLKLNEKAIIRDSLNQFSLLRDIFSNKQERILVCRFLETNCASCIKYSIEMLCAWVETVKLDNVLFLGTYRNNRIFNKEKKLYKIEGFDVFNVSGLNIPAEEENYPYYFILDSSLNISDLFFPDKATPDITKRYFDLIRERYFLNYECKEKG